MWKSRRTTRIYNLGARKRFPSDTRRRIVFRGYIRPRSVARDRVLPVHYYRESSTASLYRSSSLSYIILVSRGNIPPSSHVGVHVIRSALGLDLNLRANLGHLVITSAIYRHARTADACIVLIIAS